MDYQLDYKSPISMVMKDTLTKSTSTVLILYTLYPCPKQSSSNVSDTTLAQSLTSYLQTPSIAAGEECVSAWVVIIGGHGVENTQGEGGLEVVVVGSDVIVIGGGGVVAGGGGIGKYWSPDCISCATSDLGSIFGVSHWTRTAIIIHAHVYSWDILLYPAS